MVYQVSKNQYANNFKNNQRNTRELNYDPPFRNMLTSDIRLKKISKCQSTNPDKMC
jgi:hypothetical protein